MANLAALGLFWRKPWGRVVTFLVAVLAISIVLVPLITEETFISPIQITTNLSAPNRSGFVWHPGVCRSQQESGRAERDLHRQPHQFLGRPALDASLAMYSFDAIMLFFHPEPIPNTDSHFATLVIPSGFIAGSMLFASSLCLLIPRWKRPTTVIALMIAAVSRAGGPGSVHALERFAGAQPWGAARGLFCFRLYFLPGWCCWC